MSGKAQSTGTTESTPRPVQPELMQIEPRRIPEFSVPPRYVGPAIPESNFEDVIFIQPARSSSRTSGGGGGSSSGWSTTGTILTALAALALAGLGMKYGKRVKSWLPQILNRIRRVKPTETGMTSTTSVAEDIASSVSKARGPTQTEASKVEDIATFTPRSGETAETAHAGVSRAKGIVPLTSRVDKTVGTAQAESVGSASTANKGVAQQEPGRSTGGALVRLNEIARQTTSTRPKADTEITIEFPRISGATPLRRISDQTTRKMITHVADETKIEQGTGSIAAKTQQTLGTSEGEVNKIQPIYVGKAGLRGASLEEEGITLPAYADGPDWDLIEFPKEAKNILYYHYLIEGSPAGQALHFMAQVNRRPMKYPDYLMPVQLIRHTRFMGIGEREITSEYYFRFQIDRFLLQTPVLRSLEIDTTGPNVLKSIVVYPRSLGLGSTSKGINAFELMRIKTKPFEEGHLPGFERLARNKDLELELQLPVMAKYDYIMKRKFESDVIRDIYWVMREIAAQKLAERGIKSLDLRTALRIMIDTPVFVHYARWVKHFRDFNFYIATGRHL